MTRSVEEIPLCICITFDFGIRPNVDSPCLAAHGDGCGARIFRLAVSEKIAVRVWQVSHVMVVLCSFIIKSAEPFAGERLMLASIAARAPDSRKNAAW